MGAAILRRLRADVFANFLSGKFSFRFSGTSPTRFCIRVTIEYKHNNEFAVTIFDPVSFRRTEVLRIFDAMNPSDISIVPV